MMTNHFNALRDKGVEIYPEDTLWIDIFARYVIDNKLMSREKLVAALSRTIEVTTKGQTSKDVINLLRKFDIDYKPIDAEYESLSKKFDEIFKELNEEKDRWNN